MLVEELVDMGWANLSRRDPSLREPSSEVRYDLAIQLDGTRGVTPFAEIASEGLTNYVNLVTRTPFTSASAAA
jgi:hypothetical protein